MQLEVLSLSQWLPTPPPHPPQAVRGALARSRRGSPALPLCEAVLRQAMLVPPAGRAVASSAWIPWSTLRLWLLLQRSLTPFARLLAKGDLGMSLTLPQTAGLTLTHMMFFGTSSSACCPTSSHSSLRPLRLAH